MVSTPTQPQDVADLAELHAAFRKAAERARALAAAMARSVGHRDEVAVAAFVAEALAPYWTRPAPMRSEATRDVPRDDAAGDARRPQELVVDILRELDGEATIPQLLNVLDDMGHQISANHLSVLLTRLAQSGVIERVGRGRYAAR
jgi:hypothetical protein